MTLRSPKITVPLSPRTIELGEISCTILPDAEMPNFSQRPSLPDVDVGVTHAVPNNITKHNKLK
jgi:hypothetical protein